MWAEERTVSSQEKQTGNATQIWWACLPAHMHRFDVMDSNVRTREEQRAVFCIGGASL